MAAKPQSINIAQETARSTLSWQLGVSLGLSALFLVVYSTCNWITARRANVPTFYFEWERSIPFVPLLIVPYMSIDLFFMAAPFLCRAQDRLCVFARRVVFATLVAGLCFLLFPLRFAFARPPAFGLSGLVFNWFRTIDAPFNLVPSLHAAYWLLLADVYGRETRGFMRLTIMAWFALIAVSPVLTYQHHVIDIVTGLALGGLCLGLFRNRLSSPVKSQPSNNRASISRL